MKRRVRFLLALPAAFLLLCAPLWAGYKARTWSVGARDRYPASLTSEGVTIAVAPLYTDEIASRVFDRGDIVTRGIMPLAIIIFNDNDYPIEVDGMSIELINGEDRIRTLPPNEVVYRLYRKDRSWVSSPIPKLSRGELNEDALDDIDAKFLMDRIVPPHDKASGFLYMHIRSNDPLEYLSKSLLYIPNVYRRDNDSRLIFFEIEVAPALKANPLGDMPPGKR